MKRVYVKRTNSMSEDSTELKKALKKMADYLSRRSHSEKELVLKLSKTFSLNVIEKALEKARQNHWLETAQELSEKISSNLHKKNKSWNYIKNYLYERELPLPGYDREKEVKKAKNLLIKKYKSLEKLSSEEKKKLKQFLAYRGFEETVVKDLFGY